jgi:hypothetical protein
MRTFLTLVFTLTLIFSLQVQAQVFPSEVWHQGTAVLISDDTLKGLIKYDFENDAIQLKTEEDRIKAFSAHKLFYFEIYDTGIKSYRHFYSLPFQVKQDYAVPMLFEVLYEGRLTLLCREKIVQDVSTQANTDISMLPNDSRIMLDFQFYFLEKDGQINLYEPKKRMLLSIMDRKYNEVKKYMRRNKLRHDHISDLVRITAYYNALGE